MRKGLVWAVHVNCWTAGDELALESFEVTMLLSAHARHLKSIGEAGSRVVRFSIQENRRQVALIQILTDNSPIL